MLDETIATVLEACDWQQSLHEKPILTRTGESHLPLIKGGINLATAIQRPIHDSIIRLTGGGCHDGPEIDDGSSRTGSRIC
jgi:hypothetical protein